MVSPSKRARMSRTQMAKPPSIGLCPTKATTLTRGSYLEPMSCDSRGSAGHNVPQEDAVTIPLLGAHRKTEQELPRLILDPMRLRFPKQAADTGTANWAKVDSSIHTQCFTGWWCALCLALDHTRTTPPPYRDYPPALATTPLTKRTRPTFSSNEACRLWNRPHGDECGFAHVFSTCRSAIKAWDDRVPSTVQAEQTTCKVKNHSGTVSRLRMRTVIDRGSLLFSGVL